MKTFEAPVVEVLTFEVEDVITVSGGNNGPNCTAPINPFG